MTKEQYADKFEDFLVEKHNSIFAEFPDTDDTHCLLWMHDLAIGEVIEFVGEFMANQKETDHGTISRN